MEEEANGPRTRSILVLVAIRRSRQLKRTQHRRTRREAEEGFAPASVCSTAESSRRPCRIRKTPPFKFDGGGPHASCRLPRHIGQKRSRSLTEVEPGMNARLRCKGVSRPHDDGQTHQRCCPAHLLGLAGACGCAHRRQASLSPVPVARSRRRHTRTGEARGNGPRSGVR